MNRSILVALLLVFMLSGCSKKDGSSDEFTKSEISIDENYQINAEAIEICSYDKDKLTEILNAQSNFTVADELIVNIPASAPVLEFTTREPYIPVWDQDFEEYYGKYKECFEYFFPDHELNEEYLYYYGENSKEEYDDSGVLVKRLSNVKDNKDALMKNEGGSIQFEYNEGMYSEDKGIIFTVGPDVDHCLGIIDRKGVYGSETEGEGIILPPDSEQSFMLADKEISVKAAVSFFEDYINSVPYPKEPNVKMKVTAVEAVKTDDDKYYYRLYTAKCYEGVYFESSLGSMGQFSHITENFISMNLGLMTNSSEVDFIEGITRKMIIEDVSQYEKVVPFDKAAERISSELTDQVEFEVRMAEFVYIRLPIKTAEGYIDINGYPMNVKPVWKLTLYNPNDNNTYLCYLAADGSDFTYSVRLGEQIEKHTK